MSIPENKTKISIKIHPNAARNEVVSFIEGVLRVRISAPPVKGKANKELIAFFSRLLHTRKDAISIIKGHTNKKKLVIIDGLSKDTILNLLLQDKNK